MAYQKITSAALLLSSTFFEDSGAGALQIKSAAFGDGFSGGGASAFDLSLDGNTLSKSGTGLKFASLLEEDLACAGFTVTGLAAPSADSDACTKAYADAIATGLSEFKNSAHAATGTADGNIADLAAGAPLVVDGITVVAGDRILVKNQTDPIENGIYTVTTAGSGSNGVWARSGDMGPTDTASLGTYLFVDYNEDATANSATAWVLSTTDAADPDAILVGSEEMEFTKFSSISETTAGAGLTLSAGNIIDVVATDESILVGSNDLAVQFAAGSGLETQGGAGGGVKISALGVTTEMLEADAIDGTKLADNAVDSEHITAGSIDLAHMSVNSIDSDQYVDGSIDLIHMSANSIDSDQYVDGSIDTVHLSADAVDGTKLADDAVDSEHIASGAVDDDHLSLEVQGRLADNVLDDSAASDIATYDEDSTEELYGPGQGWIVGSGNEGLVTESASPGNKIDIGTAGTAYNSRGELVTFSTATDALSFTSLAASGEDERYDLICLTSAGTLKAIEGVGGITDTVGPPDCNAAGDVVLAVVRITETGAVTINDADITDLRSRRGIEGSKIKRSSIDPSSLATQGATADYVGNGTWVEKTLAVPPVAGWEKLWSVTKNGVEMVYASSPSDSNEYSISGSTITVGAAMSAQETLRIKYLTTTITNRSPVAP
jgi:hypothetical protein